MNLTGTALQGQAVLTLNPGALNFGVVDVGSSVTRSFDVTNSGTIPLTITKAKAPAGVFTTATPLAEGQVIPPGDTIHQDVTFIPTDTYPGTAQYEVTGNDGNGAQSVQLFGNTDPIGAYYATLGGSRGSYLSDPTSSEYPTAGGGMAQDFRGGAIYWSPQTDAHAVHAGPILDRYKALGSPASTLGYPTTDEHPVFFFFVGNDFEHGHINFYWVLSLFFLDPSNRHARLMPVLGPPLAVGAQRHHRIHPLEQPGDRGGPGPRGQPGHPVTQGARARRDTDPAGGERAGCASARRRNSPGGQGGVG